jgi:hypothetical protein
VALSELRLNSALVNYLRRYDKHAEPPTGGSTPQQYQPWSLDRRFSEADIQIIVAEFLSGTPKHELRSVRDFARKEWPPSGGSPADVVI